jgi:hypothetical protein
VNLGHKNGGTIVFAQTGGAAGLFGHVADFEVYPAKSCTP